MKVLAVLAHDKQVCLNRFLFKHIINRFEKQGHEVTKLDLYKHNRHIPFYTQAQKELSTTKTSLEEFEFFQESKKQFFDADILVICFPVYTFCMPGILKAWFDLVAGFALDENGYNPNKQKHHIKKTFVVATMGMPWIYKVLGTGNCLRKQIKTIFRFVGIKKNLMYEITSVASVNKDNINKHLKKIDALLGE
ncbi:MAG: NAD(P)H-dependent oxidoreductase [bacterium]